MNENLAKLWIAVGSIVATLFLVGSVETNGLFSDDTAAWVQAIGSIAAVIGAAWIANEGVREQRRKDAEAGIQRAQEKASEELECRNRAATLIVAAADEVGRFLKDLDADPPVILNKYRMKSLAQLCRRVTDFDHSTLRPSSAMLIYARAEIVCQNTLELLTKYNENFGDVGAARLVAAKKYSEMITEVRDELRAFSDKIIATT